MKASINTTNNVQDILFPVCVVKSQKLTGIKAKPKCRYSVIGRINGEIQQLSTCGDRYNLISNKALIMPILMLLSGYKYEVKIRTINDSAFEIKILITDKRLAIKVGNKGDYIYPMIGLNRSYDSGSKYFMYGGYYRIICSNGLTVPVENTEHFEIRGKHTEKLNDTLAKMRNVVKSIIKNAKKATKKFEVMYDTKVENYGDRVIEVMNASGLTPVKTGETKKGKWENTKNLDHVLATIRSEMAELGETKANNWLIYNGINRYIFDDEMNVKNDDVRKELDKKVLELLSN
jgi:hypothetical protein